MSYKARHDTEGTFHHLMNRGARRDLVFFDDADRRTFLGLVVESAQRTDAEIHAYCLLGNHWHFVIRSGGDLGKTMQLALSRYVRWFNRRHGFDGPLFRSRYRSKRIETDAQFIAVSRYIHRNALDAGAPSLTAYEWSSYRFFVERPPRRPTWLNTQRTLAHFEGDRRRYQLVVETADRPATTVRLVDPEPPLDAGPREDWALDEVVEAVAIVSGMPAADIEASRPGVRNPARLAVFVLAGESALELPAIATGLHCSTDESARRLVGRARQRLRSDRAFAALVENARRLLTTDEDAAAPRAA